MRSMTTTRSVVTNFLLHEKRILIVRRSAVVSTYQGKWAGISGYIESGDKSPLDRAVKEIEEETGLRRTDLTLIREGKPLRIEDREQDRKWVVHPFLWKIEAEKIRLDWENVESRWIMPEELSDYDTVPQLRETLELVLG